MSTEQDPAAVDVAVDAGWATATVRGEIDRANAAAVAAQLTADRDAETLVVDLTGVTYLDSAGVAMLEDVSRAVTTQLVVAPTAVVRRTLEVTGLLELLPTYESVDEARRGRT